MIAFQQYSILLIPFMELIKVYNYTWIGMIIWFSFIQLQAPAGQRLHLHSLLEIPNIKHNSWHPVGA